jgi:hypothetical protein
MSEEVRAVTPPLPGQKPAPGTDTITVQQLFGMLEQNGASLARLTAMDEGGSEPIAAVIAVRGPLTRCLLTMVDALDAAAGLSRSPPGAENPPPAEPPATPPATPPE